MSRSDGGGFKDRDLSADVLSLLQEFDGQLTLKKIAKEMGDSEALLQETVEDLQAEGEVVIVKGDDWNVSLCNW